MESFGTTPLALHIFTVLQASLTFRFFYTLICGGLRVFKWFFWSLGIHSTIASVIGAVSCRTDCEWVLFLQMKLGCDSDLPVWQVAVVVLSVGGEDLRSLLLSQGQRSFPSVQPRSPVGPNAGRSGGLCHEVSGSEHAELLSTFSSPVTLRS